MPIMQKIHFEITTPERQVLKDEVDSVTATTQAGEVTILPGHIALIAPLASGELRVKKGEKEEYLAVAGGFLEVRPEIVGDPHKTKVIILADSAERVEEIESAKAEEARERARKAMAEYRVTDTEKFTEATAAFERAVAQLKVARRKHARSKSSSL